MLAVIHSILLDVGPPPAHGAVEACSLTTRGGWVGLDLTSPWLLELVSRVVAAVHTHAPAGPGEDALRPKSHLHLSLAYGVQDVGPYALLAQALVDPAAPGGWEVAMWERDSAEGRGHRGHGGPALWTRLPLESPSPHAAPSPCLQVNCCGAEGPGGDAAVAGPGAIAVGDVVLPAAVDSGVAGGGAAAASASWAT